MHIIKGVPCAFSFVETLTTVYLYRALNPRNESMLGNLHVKHFEVFEAFQFVNVSVHLVRGCLPHTRFATMLQFKAAVRSLGL